MFVKICGITNEADALLATALGAHALGFVFAPSKRQIAPQVARDIVRRLPPEILTVGVFRDEVPERVVEICFDAGLKAAQLHGHEPPEVTRQVRSKVGLVIQGFAAGSPALARAADHGADLVLVDAPSPGSGQVFDWRLVDDVPHGMRVVLAGGLRPDNVAEAIRTVRPFGVDVSSGVEREPGRKDAVAMKAFIDTATRELRRVAAADRPSERPGAPYDWASDGN